MLATTPRPNIRKHPLDQAMDTDYLAAGRDTDEHDDHDSTAFWWAVGWSCLFGACGWGLVILAFVL